MDPRPVELGEAVTERGEVGAVGEVEPGLMEAVGEKREAGGNGAGGGRSQGEGETGGEG